MASRETEELFFRAITWPTGIEDFLANADEATRRSFDATFAGSPELGAVERMQVYAEAYFYRLAGVLGEQFPTTAYLMGATAFHNLATDYVLARPSRNADVREFGADFAEFLAAHPLSQDAACLPEIARIEWSIITAVDAPDEAPLDATALASLPQSSWPGLRLVPSATLRVLPCRVDFISLCDARRSDTPRREVTLVERAPPEWIAVWRQDLEVFRRRVSSGEGTALGGLSQGLPFSEWCDLARAEDPDIGPEAVAAWLRTWIESGMIVGMHAG